MPAFALGVLSIAILVVMDAFIKDLSATHYAPALVALRFFATAAWVLPIMLYMQHPWPRGAALRGHALRSALTMVSNACFFHALSALPLADVFAISFLGPIFIAVLGVVLHGERLGIGAGVAIAVAFAGMLVIVKGGQTGSASDWPMHGLAAALGAPLTYAVSISLLKKQAVREPPVVIILVQAVLISIMAAPFAAAGWSDLVPKEWLQVAIVGLLSAAGYLMLVNALAGISAIRYAVVEFTGLIWAALLGYAIFREVPGLAVWVGSAMIAAGCLLIAMEKDAR